MGKIQKDGNVYSTHNPVKQNIKRKQITSQQEKQASSFSIKSGMTNQFLVQKELHTVGIYDHEWEALHNNVKYIKRECSKFNIGPFLDGFGTAIFIPLIINFFKLLNLKAQIPDEIIVECYVYGFLLIVYIISLTIRKVFKVKWLTSYTRFDSDIRHLDDRMNEIEKRLDIEKKETNHL